MTESMLQTIIIVFIINNSIFYMHKNSRVSTNNSQRTILKRRRSPKSFITTQRRLDDYFEHTINKRENLFNGQSSEVNYKEPKLQMRESVKTVFESTVAESACQQKYVNQYSQYIAKRPTKKIKQSIQQETYESSFYSLFQSSIQDFVIKKKQQIPNIEGQQQRLAETQRQFEIKRFKAFLALVIQKLDEDPKTELFIKRILFNIHQYGYCNIIQQNQNQKQKQKQKQKTIDQNQIYQLHYYANQVRSQIQNQNIQKIQTQVQPNLKFFELLTFKQIKELLQNALILMQYHFNRKCQRIQLIRFVQQFSCDKFNNLLNNYIRLYLNKQKSSQELKLKKLLKMNGNIKAIPIVVGQILIISLFRHYLKLSFQNYPQLFKSQQYQFNKLNQQLSKEQWMFHSLNIISSLNLTNVQIIKDMLHLLSSNTQQQIVCYSKQYSQSKLIIDKNGINWDNKRVSNSFKFIIDLLNLQQIFLKLGFMINFNQNSVGYFDYKLIFKIVEPFAIAKQMSNFKNIHPEIWKILQKIKKNYSKMLSKNQQYQKLSKKDLNRKINQKYQMISPSSFSIRLIQTIQNNLKFIHKIAKLILKDYLFGRNKQRMNQLIQQCITYPQMNFQSMKSMKQGELIKIISQLKQKLNIQQKSQNLKQQQRQDDISAKRQIYKIKLIQQCLTMKIKHYSYQFFNIFFDQKYSQFQHINNSPIYKQSPLVGLIFNSRQRTQSNQHFYNKLKLFLHDMKANYKLHKKLTSGVLAIKKINVDLMSTYIQKQPYTQYKCIYLYGYSIESAQRQLSYIHLPNKLIQKQQDQSKISCQLPATVQSAKNIQQKGYQKFQLQQSARQFCRILRKGIVNFTHLNIYLPLLSINHLVLIDIKELIAFPYATPKIDLLSALIDQKQSNQYVGQHSLQLKFTRIIIKKLDLPLKSHNYLIYVILLMSTATKLSQEEFFYKINQCLSNNHHSNSIQHYHYNQHHHHHHHHNHHNQNPYYKNNIKLIIKDLLNQFRPIDSHSFIDYLHISFVRQVQLQLRQQQQYNFLLNQLNEMNINANQLAIFQNESKSVIDIRQRQSTKFYYFRQAYIKSNIIHYRLREESQQIESIRVCKQKLKKHYFNMQHILNNPIKSFMFGAVTSLQTRVPQTPYLNFSIKVTNLLSCIQNNLTTINNQNNEFNQNFIKLMIKQKKMYTNRNRIYKDLYWTQKRYLLFDLFKLIEDCDVKLGGQLLNLNLARLNLAKAKETQKQSNSSQAPINDKYMTIVPFIDDLFDCRLIFRDEHSSLHYLNQNVITRQFNFLKRNASFCPQNRHWYFQKKYAIFNNPAFYETQWDEKYLFKLDIGNLAFIICEMFHDGSRIREDQKFQFYNRQYQFFYQHYQQIVEEFWQKPYITQGKTIKAQKTGEFNQMVQQLISIKCKFPLFRQQDRFRKLLYWMMDVNIQNRPTLKKVLDQINELRIIQNIQ